MSKTTRIIALMLALNERKKFNVSELAEEFGVSYRTMLRDLQELSSLGVPLYSEVGTNGGYYTLQQRTLPPIIFTVDEAVSMYFILQSLEYYGSLPFKEETNKAIHKFYQYLPEDAKIQIDHMKDRLVFWNPNRTQSSEILQQILDASVSHRMITIHYESISGVKERDISPIGLYTYNGYWYCPSYCYDQKGFRLFRADRISRVTLNPSTETLEDLLNVSVMEWLKPLENELHHPYQLIVTLTPEGLRRCSSDLSLGHLIVEQTDGNGRIETTIPEKKFDYYTDLIFSLGEHATVIEPNEVIERMKVKIARMVQLY